MNRISKVLIATLSLAAGGVWLNIAHAASFDCAKARTKVEKLICADPFISKLDSQLGKVYDKDLAKANAEQKKRLVTDERYWLKNMRDLCTTQTCFKHAYWQRLAELETFYMPHSPMYAKASDKASAIQEILKTAPLFPSNSSKTKTCSGIFQALKDMKGVEFVNPVVQVMSYASPKLVPFRREVAKRDKKRFPQNAPLSFDYLCDPNMSALSDVAVQHGGLNYCRAYYGLPPFKLFEIPWGKAHPNKIRYIFYSDGQYGPMNREGSPHFLSSGMFMENVLYDKGRKISGAIAPTITHGFRANYNSLIKYMNQYYFLMINRPSKAYWMGVKNVRSRHVCRWYPQKSRAAGK